MRSFAFVRIGGLIGGIDGSFYFAWYSIVTADGIGWRTFHVGGVRVVGR